MALINKLEDIGNAIRSKTGGTELLKLDEMPAAIESIAQSLIDLVAFRTTSPSAA